jgi:hypothetical protein
MAEVPTLAVTGTVVEVPALHRQPVAKSDTSIRRVVLPAFVVEVLARRHAVAAARRAGPFGPAVDPARYVFATSQRLAEGPGELPRAWRRAMARTGIPGAEKVTRHTLRRSVGTLVAAASVATWSPRPRSSGTPTPDHGPALRRTSGADPGPPGGPGGDGRIDWPNGGRARRPSSRIVPPQACHGLTRYTAQYRVQAG